MNALTASLNVVDLLMAVVSAVIIYAGWRGRIVPEFIKLFGTFIVMFVTLHYYARFTDFMSVQFFEKNRSTEFFTFSLLVILLSIIVFIATRGWDLIIKMKPYPRIDRYGGVALSIMRSYFVCGMIFFALILARNGFVTPAAKASFSCHLFRHVAEDFYRASYVTLSESLFPNEEINEAAIAVTSKKKNEK